MDVQMAACWVDCWVVHSVEMMDIQTAEKTAAGSVEYLVASWVEMMDASSVVL